jgi:hypothetical protein
MNTANINKLIVAVAIIAVALIIYFIARQTLVPHQQDEQEEVVCGNKKVFRYRNPTAVFPSFTRDYETAVTLTNSVLHKLADSIGETGLGTNIKNKVIELQEKLDQENITFTMSMKSYFFMMNADPCNDSLRYRWMTITEDMTRRMLELKETTKELATVQTNTNNTKMDVNTTTPTHTENTNPATNTTDTASVNTIVAPKPSEIALKKDTQVVRRSIYKIDELLDKNKSRNKIIFRQDVMTNKLKLQ